MSVTYMLELIEVLVKHIKTKHFSMFVYVLEKLFIHLLFPMNLDSLSPSFAECLIPKACFY